MITLTKPPMPYKPFYYCWEWDFSASPEALWPLFANTNRFDRDTGLGALARLSAQERSIGHGRVRQKLVQYGLPLAYEQEPFEWHYPSQFGVYRRFSSGPVAELRVRARFQRLPTGGTHFSYETWATPANGLGLLAIPLQVGVLAKRSFDHIFSAYAGLAEQNQGLLEAAGQVRLAPGGPERLEALRRPLIERGAAPALVERLFGVLRQSDDLAVGRMRPYALADHWKTSRKATLEMFLQATRLGGLDLQWEVLCPLCRGASQSATTLSEVNPQVHCGSCNIDYTANFERQVELTFRPNPTIRPVNELDYCIGGPESTPHVVAQKLAAPGEQIELTPQLEPGRYRLRTYEHSAGSILPGGLLLADPALPAGERYSFSEQAEANTGSTPEITISTAPRLLCTNHSAEERLFILERTAWGDQAVLGAEVTALQMFRDLFSSEALRPDVQMAVGSLALVFTDLRNSTRMYREIGDAPAFGQVLSHFDIVRRAVAAEEGAVVKTMGDGVMAAFRSPAAALRAARRAQAELGARLPLKVGLHFGPCIAVTLNERLDYFGSTVNIAARLSDLSGGADLVISQAVYQDPEVQQELAAGGWQMQSFSQTLKGFEQAESLWRVIPT